MMKKTLDASPPRLANTYSDDPSHWTNRYPWNRKGTYLRTCMEHYFSIMSRAPGSEIGDRREAIVWLKSLLDKKGPELFP